MELLDTERNYLNYLLAIQKVFYEPLSKCDHLDSQELKTIFGHFPPLLEVHSAICQNLEKLIDHDWKETNEIGKVFLPHVSLMPDFVFVKNQLHCISFSINRERRC
jgi:hypothetical protein